MPMDQVLGDLPLLLCLCSKDLSSHVDHLWEVFVLSQKHGLAIGLPKCEFAVSKIEFLGHLLSTIGCSPLSRHSAVISAFPPPSDKPLFRGF